MFSATYCGLIARGLGFFENLGMKFLLLGIIVFSIGSLFIIVSSFWNIKTGSLYERIVSTKVDIIRIFKSSFAFLFRKKKNSNETSLKDSKLITGVQWTLISVALLLGLYSFFSQNSLASAERQSIKLVAEFDTDPAQTGLGFISVYPGPLQTNTANLMDTIIVPPLNKGNIFGFTAYLDFRNRGNLAIEDAKAKIYSHYKQHNTLEINGYLSALNCLSIIDKSTLVNLPDSFKITLARVTLENSHDVSSTAGICDRYDHKTGLDVDSISKHGVELGNLDAFMNGWCDQGYLVASYIIESL